MFKDTGILFGWTLRVLGQFFRVSRKTAWVSIACLTAARITRMLAFLLPLKVILLAGSEGIPRYFRFLFSPESKGTGIMVLSVAAVVAYALTVFLESRPKRLSECASIDLLAASGVMSVVSGQREQLQGFYASFTQVAAGVLFATAALAALLAIAPAVALFLICLLSGFYLLTIWVLHGVTPLRRRPLSNFIIERLSNYLGVLSSVAFLSSFLVILYPLVVGDGSNILVAIIAFVLVRQVLGALSSSIRDVVWLVGQKPLIDALVFPDRQLTVMENKVHRTLRELFGRRDRERLASAELAGCVRSGQSLRVEWRDPLLPGTVDFAISLENNGAPTRHFRQRVFPPRLTHIAENEDLLFSHIERKAVWAPPIVRRFSHGEHECLIWDAGANNAPAMKQWRAVEDDFLADLWSFELPPDLRKIYASSHRFLHQRLTDDLVARMDIGVDSDAEAAALGCFCDALPTIRDTLADMPLRLVNPEFRRENVVIRPEGGFYVLGWGQWSLEPIGAGGPLKPPAAEDRLAAILVLARARHPTAIPDSVDVRHLLLAHRCSLLERAILRGTMKAGLVLARQIASDLMPADESRDVSVI